MLTWNDFVYFAIPALLIWGLSAVLSFKDGKRTLVIILNLIGLLIFASYITGMWISLERPPLRTLGETRLWYSGFLALAGFITYLRWKYKWILSFSTIMATVFIVINIVKPEIHNKTLMPALQSPWFAPHVIVYMFSYATLGAATIVSLYFLFFKSYKISQQQIINLVDNFVYVGLSFLTIGMLFGALWAKEAWGHYWSWDPKETWAAITWMGYLLFVHLRHHKPKQYKQAMIIAVFSFVLLQICWYGVNYLPSAVGSSIHTYSLD